MTYEQIKFAINTIRKFENQRKVPCYEAMDSLLDRTRFYFTEIDFQNIYLNTYRKSSSSLTNEDMISDCNAIISTLEGMLAKDKNYPIVRNIIKEIEQLKKCKSRRAIREAIKTIYHTYSDRIKFSKVIEKIILEEVDYDPIVFEYKDNGFSKPLLDSMLKVIENYAVDICNEKPKNKTIKEQKAPTINNIIQNNNTFAPVIDINIQIEDAISKVKEECLPESQEKEVLCKIQELKDLLETKVSKRARWDKVKEFFKWVAEQGIQVASIVVPLLTNVVK